VIEAISESSDLQKFFCITKYIIIVPLGNDEAILKTGLRIYSKTKGNLTRRKLALH
jgi:hypothetical protein